MALVDLKTDLKSLKYGKDRVGGGYSGQPFVQKPLPKSLSQTGNTGGFDFLLRGGTLVAESTLDDVSRLTQLLVGLKSIQGPLFTVKQLELSRTGVRTQVSQGALNGGGYNPLKTIEQAIENSIGGHLPKQQIGDRTYFNVVKNLPVEKNRLIELKGSLIDMKSTQVDVLSYPGGPGAFRGKGTTHIRLGDQRTGDNNAQYDRYVTLVKDPKLRIDYLKYNSGQERPVELDYIYYISKDLKGITGGSIEAITKFARNESTGEYSLINSLAKTSNSTLIISGSALVQTGTRNLGINSNLSTTYSQQVLEDKTKKAKFYYTPASETYKKNIKNPAQKLLFQTGTIQADGTNLSTGTSTTPKTLFNKTTLETAVPEQNTAVTVPEDFRKKTSLRPQAGDYTKYNRPVTFTSGDPGWKNIARNIDPSKATDGKGVGVDKINFTKLGTQTLQDDLTPFYFRIYNADPNNSSTFIQFRAFLNSISDSFKPEWNKQQFMGRGENFYTYGGFDRTFNFSFDVHAQSRPELLRMYEKLNYLASAMAPTYSGGGFMRGTFIELTIGDYIVNTPGILEGIDFNINDDSPWETGRDQTGRDLNQGNKLPHLINVNNLTFKPIHNFVPQLGSQFISLGPEGQGYGDNGGAKKNPRRARVQAGALIIPPDSPDANSPN